MMFCHATRQQLRCYGSSTLALCAAFALGQALAEEESWQLPQAPAEAYLPRLTAELALDGDLDEWHGVPSVPLRCQSFIAHRLPEHQWQGPADLSAEFLCAWHDAGLCLAVIVHDDDLVNEREPALLWQQDCLELFVDCRPGERFRKPPYSPGACQIFVRPPLADKEPLIVVNPRDGALPGLKIAGKTITGGYQLEILLPWRAFPDFKAAVGASLGLQFAIDDYDRRDGAANQPLMMSWQGATSLFNSPQKLMRWTLVENLAWGENVSLAAHWAIDVANTIAEGEAAKIAILGPSFSPQPAQEIKVKTLNWRKDVVGEATLALQPCEAPWLSAAATQWTWPFRSQPDGVYAVEITVTSANGILGKARRHFLLCAACMASAQKAIASSLAAVANADLPAMAKDDPWRAKAWLGLAANVEKVKWASEIRDFPMTRFATEELLARLSLLTTGKLPDDASGIMRLLVLTTQADAQVVVEYPCLRNQPANAAQRGAVNFYWGSLPLASCTVWEYPSEEEAKASATASSWWGLVETGEDLAIEGQPARLTTGKYDFLAYDLNRFDPARQIAVCSAANRLCLILKISDLDFAQGEALSLAEGVAEEMATRLRQWAEKKHLQLLPLAAAMQRPWFVAAGEWHRQAEAEALRKARCYLVLPRTGAAMIKTSRRRLMFQCRAPTRAVAEHALRLTMAGKPVAASDTARLRQSLSQAIPAVARNAALAGGMRVFAGDVHTHSCYSDGSLTAVGMFLQGMYNQMDFMVLSDHNTIEGARVAAHLFAKYQLRYPAIVGEEITTNWIHANAYPLKALIAPTLSPEETVAAAHQQGAVIQWNHPGSYDAEWFQKHGATGLTGTGMDAWEHYPPLYAQWKREDRLPTLVGSSDTHSSTFEAGERTAIIAPQISAEELAKAVRAGNAVLVSINEPEYVYGTDNMIAAVSAALSDNASLREQTAAAGQRALAQCELANLLRQSPARARTVEDLAKETSGE